MRPACGSRGANGRKAPDAQNLMHQTQAGSLFRLKPRSAALLGAVSRFWASGAFLGSSWAGGRGCGEGRQLSCPKPGSGKVSKPPLR
eukprot:59414-Alexandrium_andersonii.AAC.1